MRLAKGLPRLPVWIVGLLTFAGLVMHWCAVNSAYGEVGFAPTRMTTQVLTPYNEGAAAFRAGDFPKAKERYQAALDEAHLLGDDAGIGACLAGLGAVYQVVQDYPKAIDSFSAALGYFIKTGNLPSQALAYGAIGEVHAQMGDYGKAVKAFDRGLSIAEKVLANASEQEKLTMLSLRGIALVEKAAAHEKLGQFAEAVENYRQAAADFEKVGDKWREGLALWSAGRIVRAKIGKPAEAIQLLARASDLYDESGKVAKAALPRGELAWAYLQSGDYKQAQTVASALVEVAAREGLPEVVFQGYFVRGQAFESLYQYDQALRDYQAALESLREARGMVDPKDEAVLLWLKGRLHRLLSQYEEAIEDFHGAAVRYREAGDTKSQAEVLTQLAEVFSWLAEHRVAIEYYKQALALYESAGNIPRQVDLLAALAEATWLGAEGPSDEISDYLRKGAELLSSVVTAIGLNPATPLAQANERMTKKLKYDFKQQFEDLQRNYPSLSREDLYAVAYLNLMQAESKHIYRDWQMEVPSLDADYLVAAGNYFQKSGRIYISGNSLTFGTENLLIADIYHRSAPFNRDLGFELAKDWYFLAQAYYRQGDFNSAFQLLNRAKVMGILLRTPEIHWVYAALGRLYAEAGDAASAINYYVDGLALLESIQSQQGTEEMKISAFGEAWSAYRQFVVLLLDLYSKTAQEKFLLESFRYNERLKARVFLEMLGKARVTRLGGELGHLAGKEKEIRHQIAQIHRQLRAPNVDKTEEGQLLGRLESLRKSWHALQVKTAEGSPQYAQVFSPRPVTVQEVQSVLDSDAVLLEYSVDSEGSTLWVITKEQVQVHNLPGSEGLPILKQYLKMLREPLVALDEISQHTTLGRELYQVLVGPAKQQIRGKKHLIIVPDGPLYYLPFEALIVPNVRDGFNESETLTEAGYLVKDFRVSYVPSASVLVTKRKGLGTGQSRPQYPLAAFGDPVYGGGTPDEGSEINTGRVTEGDLRVASFDRLEFSAEEVRRIADIWGVPLDSAHINLGDRVTVERVRAMDLSRYRMLHFATHGVLGDQIRWTTQPALVLSQVGATGRHTALLQFSEILDLKLNAELVVLSACETALGRLREGEGVVGLTRAFLYAGASSVVVSLWKVEDQSTSLLMEQFYERLKRGESKAEALRQAKLEVLRATIELKATGMPQSLASPFYWAPFILVGEGD